MEADLAAKAKDFISLKYFNIGVAPQQSKKNIPSGVSQSTGHFPWLKCNNNHTASFNLPEKHLGTPYDKMEMQDWRKYIANFSIRDSPELYIFISAPQVQ